MECQQWCGLLHLASLNPSLHLLHQHMFELPNFFFFLETTNIFQFEANYLLFIEKALYLGQESMLIVPSCSDQDFI